MTEPLKACPFCGGSADFDAGWVFCNRCGVGYGEKDEAELRALWNRRAVEPATPKPTRLEIAIADFFESWDEYLRSDCCHLRYSDMVSALTKVKMAIGGEAGVASLRNACGNVDVDAILKVAERLDHIRDLYGTLVPFDPAVSGFDSALERPGQRTAVILMMNFVLSGEVQSALRKACGK